MMFDKKITRQMKSRLTAVFVLTLGSVILVLPVTAIADITISGVVEPASVTTGAVSETVFIADVGQPGSLTVDGGSSLIVDNDGGFAGIFSSVDVGVLTISGAAIVELNARTALWITGGALAFINDGSQVLLNGNRPGGPSNRGRGLRVGSAPGTSIVSIDGVGTHVEVVRRITLGGFLPGGVGQLALSNGATLNQISTDSSLFTSFIIGSNNSTGELILSSGSTLTSLVPSMSIGGSGFVPGTGFVDLTGGSLLEVTTTLFGGFGGGQATITVDDSTLRVLTDPAAPFPDGGSVFIASGHPSSIGNLTFNNAVGDIEDHLYISHDGASNTGQGTGQVTVCNSTLTVPEIVIGENGTLSGTTIIGNITVEGGSIEPGCSPGDMEVFGNVTVNDGKLVIEVNGPDVFDTLTVLGTADFDSADASIQLSFGNGYAPAIGDTFDFITADTLELPVIADDLITFAGLKDDIEFSLVVDDNGFEFTADSDGIPDAVSPQIDIRPGELNDVDTNSNQLIPVAILTTQDLPIFDATQVDPTTVRFGPNAEPNAKKIKLKDVDDDGDLDLRLWFRVKDTGIVCGDESAELTGETFAGTAISATDTINTVNCP